MLDETLGKVHFWLTFIGFHTDVPGAALAGRRGHAAPVRRLPAQRRVHHAQHGLDDRRVHPGRLACCRSSGTCSAATATAAGPVGRPVGLGNSLEWATSSPPPRHNFTELPRIRSERPAFELHYPHLVERLRAEAHAGTGTWRSRSPRRASGREPAERPAVALTVTDPATTRPPRTPCEAADPTPGCDRSGHDPDQGGRMAERRRPCRGYACPDHGDRAGPARGHLGALRRAHPTPGGPARRRAGGRARAPHAGHPGRGAPRPGRPARVRRAGDGQHRHAGAHLDRDRGRPGAPAAVDARRARARPADHGAGVRDGGAGAGRARGEHRRDPPRRRLPGHGPGAAGLADPPTPPRTRTARCAPAWSRWLRKAGVDVAVERAGLRAAGQAADRLRRRLHARAGRGDRDARRRGPGRRPRPRCGP